MIILRSTAFGLYLHLSLCFLSGVAPLGSFYKGGGLHYQIAGASNWFQEKFCNEGSHRSDSHSSKTTCSSLLGGPISSVANPRMSPADPVLTCRENSSTQGFEKEAADTRSTFSFKSFYPELQLRKKVIAGMVSGVFQAALFHPWDRALYLSQTNNRPFLNMKNWVSPFQGIKHTLAMRVISTTIYFPLEEITTPLFERLVGAGGLANFLAGNAAGAFGAAAVNPFQAVRYTCMSLRSQTEFPDQHRFVETARCMAAEGGYHPFLKGMAPTVVRDLVFGGIFSAVRRELSGRWLTERRPDESDEALRARHGTSRFASDLLAAVLATAVSSPFNYARNLLYSPIPHPSLMAGRVAPGGMGFRVVGQLFADAARQGSPLAAAWYLQSQLKLGFATLRVSVAMAVASSAYHYYKDL